MIDGDVVNCIQMMIIEDLKEHLEKKYRLAKNMEYREKLKADIDQFVEERFSK